MEQYLRTRGWWTLRPVAGPAAARLALATSLWAGVGLRVWVTVPVWLLVLRGRPEASRALLAAWLSGGSVVEVAVALVANTAAAGVVVALVWLAGRHATRVAANRWRSAGGPALGRVTDLDELAADAARDAGRPILRAATARRPEPSTGPRQTAPGNPSRRQAS